MVAGITTAFWENAALQNPPRRTGLIYIDADTDLTSPTSPDSSGIFAGNNMTHLVRFPGALHSMQPFTRPSGERVCDASNTVLFGINMSLPRNNREHFACLFENDYKIIGSASSAHAPEERARVALKYFEERVDTILAHFDVDSVDPSMFPLANVPNFTAVTFEQMIRALRVFVGSRQVGGLTIAEVNPDYDPGLEMVERLTNQVVEMLAARADLGKDAEVEV